jgi:hypothetical protein
MISVEWLRATFPRATALIEPHIHVLRKAVSFALIGVVNVLIDTWTVALRCPHCGRTGSGTVSEDAYGGQREPRLRVDGLSSGFVVGELRPGARQDVRCATCNSSALK